MTWVGTGTVEVSTVNVTVLAPAATVTLDGTLATSMLPLCSVTTAPPAGAAAVRVTVAVGDDWPSTLAGSTEIESSAAGAAGGGVGVGVGVGAGVGVGVGVGDDTLSSPQPATSTSVTHTVPSNRKPFISLAFLDSSPTLGRCRAGIV